MVPDSTSDKNAALVTALNRRSSSRRLWLRLLRASGFMLTIGVAMLVATGKSVSAVATTVAISAELGTSIAGDLFPVTVKLSEGNLFLSEPVVLFLEQGRIGLQVRVQAYDHRPAQGIAISEMGRATVSGRMDYDTVTKQILLHDPRIDKLAFDQKNAATQHFLAEVNSAWAAQVTNPMRAELPPHPYLLPFRNNIQDLSYDGKNINVTVSYE